ncbi:hypothetical protein [Providencia heimbachae]|uniref:Uncharacterized protein n=1 Tax=Providencia heimbachae ATCC 35613 TaxID=1354272 RepID=A0A1B7JVE8_9GAMM|nr:hypothetical protein [Providencia heimbachae]OAT51871.1 hypothetical protein M998_1866 [Providencia heimbachae ATCC 35613]QCJ71680.1 hypothetical protein C9446_18660 [Providencia heimbachae]SQH15488.1 Uncharacterised protein [Providencia heimbachae]
MTQSLNTRDELIRLKVSQLERISSILFFLIPLVILLIVGKTFAFNTLYLWQGFSLLYIVVYRLLVRKLSSKQAQLKVRRGWGYNRFYRFCWGYLPLSLIVMVGYQIIPHQ